MGSPQIEQQPQTSWLWPWSSNEEGSLATFRATCAQIQAVAKNPKEFANLFTTGILDALSTSSPKLSGFVGKHVQAIDLKRKDYELLEKLRNGEAQKIQEIWDRINQYHLIIFGGAEFCPSSQIIDTHAEKHEENNGPLNPLFTLIYNNQNQMRQIRARYLNSLPDGNHENRKSEKTQPMSVEEKETLSKLQETTNKLISDVCERLVDTIVSKQTGNSQSKKSKSTSWGIFSFFHHFYRKILHSIISYSSKNLVEVLRNSNTILQKEIQGKSFIEKYMVSPLKFYFASIEKSRARFVKDPKIEEVTFGDYLESKLDAFNYKTNNYTEKELIEHFETFLSKHCIPKPKFPIHIPILTPILENNVWKIKQWLFRFTLSQTNLVNNLIDQFTTRSDLHTKIIEKSLGDIATTLHQMEPPSKADMAAQRQLERPLDRKIVQLAPNLLRFCEVIAANENTRVLKDLDKHKYEDLIQSLSLIFPSAKTLSIQTTLENSTAQILRTSILKIRETSEQTIENHIQEIASQLKNELATEHDESHFDRLESRKEYEQKIAQLTQEISHTVIQRAHDTHRREVLGERHKRIKAFAETARCAITKFSSDANQAADNYSKETDTTEYLSKIVPITESFLNEIHSVLTSRELEECYRDVRENIQHVLRNSLETLSQLNLSPIAQLDQEITQVNRSIGDFQEITDELDGLNAETPADQIKSVIQRVQQRLVKFEEIQTQFNKEFGRVDSLLEKLKEEQKLIALENELKNGEKTLKEIAVASDQINKLIPLLDEHGHLQQPNLKYRTLKEIGEHRQIINNKIYEILSTLNGVNDEEIKKLLPLLIPTSKVPEIPSIFKSLERMEKAVKNKNEQLQKTIDAQAKQPIGENVWECLQSKFMHIQNILLSEVKTQNLTKEKKEAEFKDYIQKNQNIFNTIQKNADQIEVKGCIYLFKMKTIEAQLAESLTLKIRNYLEALTDALKDPFHLKQLFLRLLLVPIAEKENSDSK